MEMNFVFFDNNLDPEELNSLFKFGSKILSYKPCFCNSMKLRYNEKFHLYIAFKNNEHYRTSRHSYIFGTSYVIDIHELDYEILNLNYLSTDTFMLESVNVKEITFNSIDEFIEHKFEITKKKKAYCFVANETERNMQLYKNRHMNIHLNKRFLLTYKILPCIT